MTAIKPQREVPWYHHIPDVDIGQKLTIDRLTNEKFISFEMALEMSEEDRKPVRVGGDTKTI